MRISLKKDLQRLSELAYHRLEWSEGLVRELDRLRRCARGHPGFAMLEKACAWLFVPFTLWPIDFYGLCELLQQRVGNDEALEPELRLLIDSLPPLPGEQAQAVAAKHEHLVQRGDYDSQVKAGEKYRLNEERLSNDPEFLRAWSEMKAAFDVSEQQDHKGIIRRRMVSERGFRNDWNLDWGNPTARFRVVFDAFCHRWNLYGMEHDRPLLQRLTVNLTPHGTMIFIPSWWSFDPKRDLDWREISKLHKARAPSKQGAKLTRNQMEQAAEAERAAVLDADAKSKGLKGEERSNWVMSRLGWPNCDPRKLRLVLSRAKRRNSKYS